MNRKSDLIAKIRSKSGTNSPGASHSPRTGGQRAAAGPGSTVREKAPGEDNAWIKITRENPQAKMRMFTFHYAGGARSMYRDWWKDLPHELEILSVQLPGREDRLNETPYRSFFPMIQSLSQSFKPYLDKPYIFFGHCMGGLTSFEVARQLRRTGLRLPEHMFISSFIGPHIPRPERKSIIFNIPEGMVDDFFVELGGTPQEVLDNLGLMTLARVVMDADLDLLRSYEYIEETPLDIPISTFGAVQDKLVIVEEIEEWRKQTSQNWDLTLYPGNHFYIQMHRPYLMRTLNQKINRHLLK